MRVTIKASPLEQCLFDQAFQHLWRYGHREVSQDEPPVEDNAPLLAALGRLERRYQEIENALASGDIPARSGGRILQRLEDERESLQAQLGQSVRSGTVRGIRAESPYVPEPILREFDRRLRDKNWQDSAPHGEFVRFTREWDERTISESDVARLQDFLRAIIAKVVVGPSRTRVRGRRFNVDRVTIEYKDSGNGDAPAKRVRARRTASAGR